MFILARGVTLFLLLLNLLAGVSDDYSSLPNGMSHSIAKYISTGSIPKHAHTEYDM